jgi:hypothetical protein
MPQRSSDADRSAESGADGSAPRPLSLAEVEAIARAAHAAQVDKAGRPYAEHLAAVALGTAQHGGDEAQIAAAWLHDAVEDDVLSAEWLDTAALPQRTKDIVLAMTRREGETLPDYTARILATPGAITVKDADLASNSSAERLALLPDAALRARLTAKYELTRRLLHPDAHAPLPQGDGADGDPTDDTLLAGLNRGADAWGRLSEFASGWAVQESDARWEGGHASYGARVLDVTAALDAVGAVTPAFHWMAFGTPLLAADGTLTPADAVRTATAVVRGERFSEGTLLSAWKNGRLSAVVRALTQWHDTATE